MIQTTQGTLYWSEASIAGLNRGAALDAKRREEFLNNFIVVGKSGGTTPFAGRPMTIYNRPEDMLGGKRSMTLLVGECGNVSTIPTIIEGGVYWVAS